MRTGALAAFSGFPGSNVSGQLKPATIGQFKTSQFEGEKFAGWRRLAVNELKLDFQQAIVRLREKGWSRRAIARELGIDRETVARYLRLDSKPAREVPAGSKA